MTDAGLRKIEESNLLVKKPMIKLGEESKTLSYWDTGEIKSRPQVPLTNILFRENKPINFSDQFSMEEKISLLSQLALKGVKITFERDSSISGPASLTGEINALFVNSEPYFVMGSFNIKVSEIKSIGVYGIYKLSLSLVRPFRLPLYNASADQALVQLSEGSSQAKAILMDLESLGGDINLLSYHLDRLNIRGSQLQKVFENYGSDKEKLLSDILSENPNLHNSYPSMDSLVSREISTYTSDMRIHPSEPWRLKDVDIDKVKTIFSSLMSEGKKVILEYRDTVHLKDKDIVRVVSGSIQNLTTTPLGPAIIVEGSQVPILMSKVNLLVLKGQDPIFVKFNAEQLALADNALALGTPKVEKSNVLEFKSPSSIQEKTNNSNGPAKILKFEKPIPKPKPEPVIPQIAQEETPAQSQKPSILSQVPIFIPPKGRLLEMPESTNPEVKKDEPGKIIIFPTVPPTAVGG